ncbi:hypothetical protein ACX3O0_01275 [Homoserinimonas sp. A447]
MSVESAVGVEEEPAIIPVEHNVEDQSVAFSIPTLEPPSRTVCWRVSQRLVRSGCYL